MENVVLTIGGLLKTFKLSDAIFFIVTLGLVLLILYLVYLIKLDKEEKPEIKKEEPKEDKTLSEIVDELSTDYQPRPIDLSDYEKEQEDTAIISYEELLNRSTGSIYYEDEYDSGFDDIVVQKVDKEKSNTEELVGLPHAVMMSYEDEEKFLSLLKTLQKNLVR